KPHRGLLAGRRGDRRLERRQRLGVVLAVALALAERIVRRGQQVVVGGHLAHQRLELRRRFGQLPVLLQRRAQPVAALGAQPEAVAAERQRLLQRSDRRLALPELRLAGAEPVVRFRGEWVAPCAAEELGEILRRFLVHPPLLHAEPELEGLGRSLLGDGGERQQQRGCHGAGGTTHRVSFATQGRGFGGGDEYVNDRARRWEEGTPR